MNFKEITKRIGVSQMLTIAGFAVTIAEMIISSRKQEIEQEKIADKAAKIVLKKMKKESSEED